MPQNTKYDSSEKDSLLEGLKDELLDMLEKARTLDDLVTSLKTQKLLIEALLILLE